MWATSVWLIFDRIINHILYFRYWNLQLFCKSPFVLLWRYFEHSNTLLSWILIRDIISFVISCQLCVTSTIYIDNIFSCSFDTKNESFSAPSTRKWMLTIRHALYHTGHIGTLYFHYILRLLLINVPMKHERDGQWEAKLIHRGRPHCVFVLSRVRARPKECLLCEKNLRLLWSITCRVTHACCNVKPVD